MDKRKSVLDVYYKYMEKQLKCQICDELLEKKYAAGKQSGSGDFIKFKIEDGIEISKIKADVANLCFDNRECKENVLEIGYCYKGNIEMLTMPDIKKYSVKKGYMYIYRTTNNLDYFKLKYDVCKAISININFNAIKSVINPIWEDKIIEDWNNIFECIFKDDALVVRKSSHKIEKLIEDIDEISTDDIIGYMKLKFKVIEFLEVFFEENSERKMLHMIKTWQERIAIKSQKIIHENLQRTIYIKELTEKLDISEYKLQEAFRKVTGDTVYEYIKKARLEKAKELLRNTDMSIFDIVNEVGYENPSKFSSLFKRYNDITPLKYRKLNKCN